MSQYFLGVDGGQSRTTALIGDERGRVLGVGIGGPSNHAGADQGRTKFISAVNTCLAAACAQAGLDAGVVRFISACLGFSGGPEDKEALVRAILRSDRTTVTHDALIALAGALAGEPGLITIAGTGSIAFGRNAAGRTARAGGWGYLFGDEGGAFWIVAQALRAALRSEEGWGPATSLRPMLLDATGGARNGNDLLHRFYTTDFPRPRIAGLAKLVDQAAEQGDPVAREILNEAARQLAPIAAAVRRQLFPPGEAVRVSYVGGVFQSALVLGPFQKLIESEPGNRVIAPVHGPAAGALLEAYHVAEVACVLANAPEEKPVEY
jgi:N-acetylglucosamine kinase-like BadF-type ATPase